MRKTSFLATTAAALAAAGVQAAIPPQSASDLVPPAYRAALPPDPQQGEVTYIAGGNKRASQDFPLELVFRQTVNGKVKDLTHVPLKITDASNKVVFQGESPGPYFIARLPAGRYTVTAHWDDWDFSKNVTIGGDRDRVMFAWKRETPRVPNAT